MAKAKITTLGKTRTPKAARAANGQSIDDQEARLSIVMADMEGCANALLGALTNAAPGDIRSSALDWLIRRSSEQMRLACLTYGKLGSIRAANGGANV